MATGRGHDEVARARDGQTTAHRALWQHSCPPPFTDVHSRMCALRCCIEGLLGARGGCQTGRGPPSSAFDGGLGCGAIGGGCSRLAPRRVPESGGRDHSTEAVSRVLFSRSGRGRPAPTPGARGAPVPRGRRARRLLLPVLALATGTGLLSCLCRPAAVAEHATTRELFIVKSDKPRDCQLPPKVWPGRLRSAYHHFSGDKPSACKG